MSELLSYLWAQAQRQPLDTLRFAAGEAWRRGRLRWVDSLDKNLPEFPNGFAGKRLEQFLPATHLEPAQLRDLPFAVVTLESAKKICRQGFEIFGEQVSLAGKIDWHTDWRTGYRWQLQRSRGVSVLASQATAPPGTDIKRPWELARFHWALALGQAYAITKAKEFAEAFAAQVRHWINENPYPRGIHWAMPMEVAVRAINWVTAAAIFDSMGALEPPFRGELMQSLFLHGRHLATHREWNPVARANHYLACVAGLLHLGALFEETQEGSAWFALARREVLAEMSSMVGADGVAREGSSGYHAFVAEIFLSCALLLARRSSRPIGNASEVLSAIEGACGKSFAGQLRRMFVFLAALCEGRERPPIWGDADDGRLLPFSDGAEGAVIPLARVGAALFGHTCPPGTNHSTAEIFWRLGVLPRCHAPQFGEQCGEAFRDAGFFFFRSPRLRGSVRCGPLGARGWSNHAHCDQLSFELCCDGRAVVVDPGLPCYAEDPAARNLFRSTRYHNVAVVAGAEQNRFWPRLLFRIMDDTRARLLKWEATPGGIAFGGEHAGYERLDVRASVTRELRTDAQSDMLTILDNFSLRGSAPVEWVFHLAPGIHPQRLDESGAIFPPNQPQSAALAWDSTWQIGPMLLRAWTSLDPSSIEVRQEEGCMAPRFGQKLPARILSFSANVRGSVIAAFEFSLRRCGESPLVTPA